jgi:hypothetical protein
LTLILRADLLLCELRVDWSLTHLSSCVTFLFEQRYVIT